uniref:Bifunctional inhibitor/plant lipid transfer protein/seed storage helical domain-containing protein n=1 Tax=Leersia perrieri TaxID=77586 RepID=A0A0D9VMJ0_9ORYZ
MAMSRSPFRLALVAASATLLLLLFISSCHASSREHPTVESSKTVVIQDDPKCEVMVPCTQAKCDLYCLSIGLDEQNGFCTFKPDFQFYCCCPVPGSNKTVVIQDDPKCEVMVPCTVPSCTGYCYSIGLEDPGFCTFKQDFQFYCCCPVPSSK